MVAALGQVALYWHVMLLSLRDRCHSPYYPHTVQPSIIVEKNLQVGL